MEKKKLKLLVCALAIGLGVSLANADIETGMVAYWPFEEGSGTTTADVTGNGHDGTLEQTPEWDVGPEGLGGALLFDVGPSGDGVYCGTACDPGDVFTLALWAYWNGNPATNTTVHFLTKSDGWDATTMRWQWELRAGHSDPVKKDTITIGCQGNTPFGSVTLSAGSMSDNEWVHLTVTYNGAVAQLYTNGVADSLGPQTFVIGTKTDAAFFIGRPGWDFPFRSFDGYLDEVRIYSRPLTPEDVQELYEFRSDPDFNAPPKVDAGDYPSLLWQDPSVTAQLNATVTDDGKPADPGEVTLTWSKLSGPGTVVFSDTTIEDPTATFSALGTYQLELEASDGEKSRSDTVGIVIRPDNNPIAHWDFDEGSGPTVNDDSTNNHVGTRTGDSEPNWVTGWVGSGAMEFSGVGSTDISSYVNITSDLLAPDPNLENLKYEVTLTAWFKIDDLANAYYPAIIANGNQGWRLYAVHTAGDRFGKVLFTPGDGLLGARTESTKSLADGYWHHVVGIYDGSKSYLYIDGVLDNSEDNRGLMAVNDNKPVTIGARATSDIDVERSWNGMIDDVRVYSYCLSEAQIADLTAMGDVPPVVDAGEDQTFSMQNDYIQLDGMVTDDGNPVAATIEWTKADGPGDVVFSDTAIEDPTATFSTTGTYILRLTADDTAATVYDEVTITVVNPTCQDIIDDGLLITGDISGPAGIPDCRINLYDFAAFAGNWLRCNNPQDIECEFPY